MKQDSRLSFFFINEIGIFVFVKNYIYGPVLLLRVLAYNKRKFSRMDVGGEYEDDYAMGYNGSSSGISDPPAVLPPFFFLGSI